MINNTVNLDISPDPGGYVRIILSPVLPFGTTCCNLVVHSSSPHYNQLYYRVKVANVKQAFVACLYLLTRRLGMEMPPDLILFDPQFYQQLPAKILSALNSPPVSLNVIASIVDNNLWCFYYY
ncbi:unnamed protein product [Hymenolepis diminuta]|nr:unnamed protein product [Hymenolepis diminuta]